MKWLAYLAGKLLVERLLLAGGTAAAHFPSVRRGCHEQLGYPSLKKLAGKNTWIIGFGRRRRLLSLSFIAERKLGENGNSRLAG